MVIIILHLGKLFKEIHCQYAASPSPHDINLWDAWSADNVRRGDEQHASILLPGI